MRTVADWADRAIATLPPAIRLRISSEPLVVMREDLGLKVREADYLTQSRSDGGACDGMSFVEDGVILFARSPQSKRQNFTLAHELGHWLLARVPGVYDWLFEQSEPGRAEETLCDAIAQRLLLPREVIAGVIGDGPIGARHVLALLNTHQASLPVCVIAMEDHLPGLGAIIVTQRDPLTGQHVVQYAALHPDPADGWPKVYPWRGQPVPPGSPLKYVTSDKPLRRRIPWTTPWGSTADFYVDAIAHDDGRVVAVFSAVDLWKIDKFHASMPREFAGHVSRKVTCCGETRVARGYPCATCGALLCPKCGMCAHQKQDNALVMCSGGCWLSYAPHLLVDGLCENCR